MKLIPHETRVLLLMDAVEEKKVGSIFIPDKHSERHRVGTVLAVGNEVDRLKKGDRIWARWDAGDVITIPGRPIKGDTLRIAVESEVYGLAKEEEIPEIDGEDQPREE